MDDRVFGKDMWVYVLRKPWRFSLVFEIGEEGRDERRGKGTRRYHKISPW